MRPLLSTFALFGVCCALSSPADAQELRLTVQAQDPSGATIPGAQVVVLSGSDVVADLKADASGQAVGSVRVRTPLRVIVSAAGFETIDIEATLPPRATTHTITMTLPLARVEADVLVVGGPDEAGALTTALTSAELAALPDDPEELQRQLEEIAGPGASIQVDGFSGGRLPPRDQIARIIVRRDAYSSEFHQVGQGRVEIVTRPGLEGWRGNAGVNFRPSAWSAHNALARQARAGSSTRLSAFAAGPIVRNRMSLVAEVDGSSSDDTRGISALTPEGRRDEALHVPFDSRDVTLRTEGLLTKQTLLRASYEREASESDNQGISELDLPERGYRRETIEHSARVAVEGGVKRPYHVRLQWRDDQTTSAPATRAPAIVVQNSFRSGGATIDGRDHERLLEIDTTWTVATRPFTVRTGAQATSLRYSQGTFRNQLGTFTFDDLAAFVSGQPTTFTQRGNPQPLLFSVAQSAFFAQAETTRRGWSIGVGARHEWQSTLNDRMALAPRVGISRAFGRNRASVRAGYGWFYGWMPVRVEEESRRLAQGSLEEEIIVHTPGYPEPFAQGIQETQRDPATLLTLAPDASLPRWARTSIGLEHRWPFGLRVQGDVFHQRTRQDFRAADQNAPVSGIRPDAAFGRRLLIDSIGRASQTGLNAELSGNRNRLFASLRYSWARTMNDADDALTPPPDGQTFATEWAPSRNAVRHRLSWNVGGPVARQGSARLCSDGCSPACPTTSRQGATTMAMRSSPIVPMASRGTRSAGIGPYSTTFACRGAYPRSIRVPREVPAEEAQEDGQEAARLDVSRPTCL